METVKSGGLSITVDADASQPFPSVTVTENDPTFRFEMVGEVEPVLHKYENGAVPPVLKTVADPSLPPQTVTS